MKKSRSEYHKQLEAERASTARILQQLTEKLRRIEAALGRLRQGVYGECQSCGKQIAAERLDLLPYTELCLECQEKHEQTKS